MLQKTKQKFLQKVFVDIANTNKLRGGGRGKKKETGSNCFWGQCFWGSNEKTTIKKV